MCVIKIVFFCLHLLYLLFAGGLLPAMSVSASTTSATISPDIVLRLDNDPARATRINRRRYSVSS
jgi:hypothetical protein